MRRVRPSRLTVDSVAFERMVTYGKPSHLSGILAGLLPRYRQVTNSQKLAIRSSEIRSRLNVIAGMDVADVTDEIRAESDTLARPSSRPSKRSTDRQSQARAPRLTRAGPAPTPPTARAPSSGPCRGG